MSFATQLASTFTPIAAVYDQPSITQALAWAQSFVEDYCNRGDHGFDLVTSDVVLCDPKPYGRAMLPRVPVANIETVEAWLPSADSSTMAWTTLTNYSYDADTGRIWNTTGLPGTTLSFGPSWPWLPQSLRVTYDHGFATIPSDLVNATCRFAQQYMENPALLLQRGMGQINDRYAGNTGGVGIVINEFDMRIMDRYTLMSIG